MSYPRHKLTAPIAALALAAGGLFLYGQKSLTGGEGQPSKGNPTTANNQVGREKAEPISSNPDDSHGKKAVSSGVSTEKKGKEAFQEAVKETRTGDPIENRTPSKERVARAGN